MIASSVVIGNLIYLVGAVALMVVLSLVVVLRHRRPKSVEANISSFHKGLRALAPDDDETGRQGRKANKPVKGHVADLHQMRPVDRTSVHPISATGEAGDEPADDPEKRAHG
ncbi:MAG: hypothetical protein ACRDXE_06880 [Acidimicrobiales bacterium]